MFFMTLLTVTLLGLFTGGRCEIGQHDNWVDRDCDCDKLYEAAVRIRDDVDLSPAMTSAYSWKIAGFADRYMNYAGVNLVNERDLRRFACAISDSNNSTDVAELLNVPEDDFNKYVFWKDTEASIDPTSTSLEKYLENSAMWSYSATTNRVYENLNYGRWVRDHGYQDYWNAWEAIRQFWIVERDAHVLRMWE